MEDLVAALLQQCLMNVTSAIPGVCPNAAPVIRGPFPLGTGHCAEPTGALLGSCLTPVSSRHLARHLIHARTSEEDP
jgi:hypothetical protein